MNNQIDDNSAVYKLLVCNPLEGRHVNDFSNKVSNLLNEGWKLHGGVSVTDVTSRNASGTQVMCVQALVKNLKDGCLNERKKQ